MKTYGMRISDKINKVISVKLSDILQEIQDGNKYHWSILYLYATGHLDNDQSIPVFENQINKSENGLFIKWEELCLFSSKLDEIMDIILIGCKDFDQLHRYKSDQEMCETCDFVISMVDSGFWEIFAKNKKIINRLAYKFKDVQFIESNF